MANIPPTGEPNNPWEAVRDQHRIVGKPEPDAEPKTERQPLRADVAELRRFIDLAFRHCAGIDGWVALRAFEHEDHTGKPAASAWCPWGPDVAEWAAEMATSVARREGEHRAVFSPPVALFGDKRNAKEARAASAANVVAGPVIAVELDSRPAEGLTRLEGVLGPATIVVESGGTWTGPDGASEKKRHCYWRLARPAVDAEDLLALTRARRLACDLVGADPTGVSVAHPMRWPGSWHTKGSPRPCRIVGGDGERDVDLADALAALETAATAAGVNIVERGAIFRGERYGFKTKVPLTAKTLADAVRLIPNGPYADEAVAWDTWVRVGMAYFDSSWASVDGFEAWHAWSAKHDSYDDEKTTMKWHRFMASPPTDLSAGTLLKLMRDSQPDYVQDREIVETWFEPPEADAAGAAVTEQSVGTVEGFTMASAAAAAVPEALDASAPVFIRDLNKRYAFVVVGGKAGIIDEKKDGTVTTLTENTFKAMYANKTRVQGRKEASIAEIWWTHPARRQYLEGVDFEPKGVAAGVYNFWRGLPVLSAVAKVERPEYGCPLFLEHLRSVICDGDETAYRYLIGWLAHIVQRPWEKPGVAVVTRGKKGNGKDTLGEYMREILLPYYMHVSSEEGLTGDKNGHFANKLLLHVEEAVWAGSHKNESILKSLITAPFMGIRFLFSDRVLMKSKMRVFMSSNAEWVVPASADERRYFVLDVSDRHRHEAAWFDSLRAELEGDGPVHLARYLADYDLAGFDVRRPPRTAALDKQKQESVSPLDRWIRDELLGAEGTTWGHADQPFDFQMKTLQGRYRHDAPGQRGSGANDIGYFSKHLKQVFELAEPKQSRANGRERFYALPTRSEARALFDSYSGTKNDWT